MSDYNKLAQAIIEAQKIHEASYVKLPDIITIGGPVPNGEYKKDQYAAAEEAALNDPQTAQLVWLLNTQCWNDAYEWAEKQLNG